MPTGYTADVQSGKVTEFKQFALQCARAFGALILLRDDPADAPIPDAFEPSSYNAKALAEATSRLAKLEAMTPAQAQAEADQEFKERTSEQRKYEVRVAEERGRYEAMIAKVQAWVPPTSEHYGLKDFMLSQLRDSIEGDCKGSYWKPAKVQTGAEWLAANIKEAIRDRDYNAKAHAAEVELAKGRTAWVQSLKASLS